MEWQPIETAPKDGTDILVCFSKTRAIEIMRWNGPSYQSFTTGSFDRFGTPDQYGHGWLSHWMPLPTPPVRS